MGVVAGVNAVNDGLIFTIDAGTTRGYPGTGLTYNSLYSGIGATLVNGVGFTSSYGGSFVFDGTNDYIEVPSISINSSFSIDLFCNLNNLSTTYVLIGKYGGGSYDFWLGVTGSRFRFSISMPNKIEPQTSTVLANTWYHVTAVYNSSLLTASIYLNGVLSQTSNGSSAFQNPPGNYAIGAFGAGGGFYIPGFLACHKYYNRVLSAAEVLQNYNSTKRRFL